MKQLADFEEELSGHSLDVRSNFIVAKAKQIGYSDSQLAMAFKKSSEEVRIFRKRYGIQPCYKLVDTCAAEFEASTPYYYSTYETHFMRNADTKDWFEDDDDEVNLTDKPKVAIIGGGPNRIGQGIEFDYCCVHAAYAMKEIGIESVMINSNRRPSARITTPATCSFSSRSRTKMC